MSNSRLDDGDHDNDNKHADADDDDDAHLHVLPPARSVVSHTLAMLSYIPHLLPDTVSATAEPLRRDCEVVCHQLQRSSFVGSHTRLVLQRVEPLATLGHLGDVLVHNVDRRVDLRLDVGDLQCQ